MQFLELTAEKAPFLSRGEVLKCKYNALALITMNSIVSIFLAIEFAIRWSHPTVRPIFIEMDHSHPETILTAAFIVLLTPLSFFSAWRLGRRLVLDLTYRKAIFWIVQSATASMLFTANMVLFFVFMMETGSHY